MSNNKIKKLLNNSCYLLNESYLNGGAELKDFKNPIQKSSLELAVYAKKIDPKGNPVLSKMGKDQRRSWFVPEIQKL